MAKLSKLVHERLISVLDYDPATGFFSWKSGHSNRMKDGARAGAMGGEDRKYRFIAVDGERFLAHRLAWFYIHKKWPMNDIRPINGDFDDCRIENLKDIPRIQIAHTRGAISTNTSGFLGVSPSTKRGKWQASITWNYKQLALGANFETAEEASEIYSIAAERLKSTTSQNEIDIVMSDLRLLRRQRGVWKHIQRFGLLTEWNSFDEFARDIKEIPIRRWALTAEDPALPIGPANYRWAMPVDAALIDTSDLGAYARHYSDAHRKHNKEQYRAKHIKKTYGAEVAYERKCLIEQKGLCAVCEKPEEFTRGHKARRLSLDHNHATGALRGLLCGNCNMALGYFCDDPEILRKAIAYLDKHKNGTPNVIPLKKTEDTA